MKWSYYKKMSNIICKFCNLREVRYDPDFCSLECKQQYELFNKESKWKWQSLREIKDDNQQQKEETKRSYDLLVDDIANEIYNNQTEHDQDLSWTQYKKLLEYSKSKNEYITLGKIIIKKVLDSQNGN